MPPRPSPPLFAVPPRFLCPSVSRQFVRTIRSIAPKPRGGTHPERFNGGRFAKSVGSGQHAAFERKEHVMPLRTGALAIKKGMTGIYDPVTAKREPCTVLQLDRCQVISHKRRDVHGYWAVQVGCGMKEAKNVSRPERGHFAKREVPIKRHLAEFRVKNEESLPEIGSLITADLFQEGQYVDARGVTRGMGFAGGMKRWGFSGQPASHGTSLTHRAMGSAGASQGSGSRVLPGKKMAGRMGGENHTVQNLKVMKVDAENGIVVVSGPVPGPKYSIVKLQDALKKPWPVVELTVGLTPIKKTGGAARKKIDAAVEEA
ncbi:54S ribosomal L9, mitochondrial [Lecanosticta acicola]|uniref:Large ribosomal subunit protein uL3m n=1 Tax=Lecanosticta acicola TaxID=111012 RepID=A0AAI9EAG5_9PEZI|nr:54S ribosomal L9, mitochondrial [Lecanosticta acicola]